MEARFLPLEFLFEQRLKFGPSVTRRRPTPWFTCLDWAKVFTKICPILVNHALGLWLAALIIERRVVKIAIKTNVN
jgi:hypothetical protein